MSDDRPSPWSAPVPTPPHGWGGAPYAPGAAVPPGYAAAPPGYAAPPIEVHLSAPPAAGARGIAVAGLVLGGLALLVSLGLLAFVGVSVFGDGGGGGGWGLRGTVDPQRGSIDGDALAQEVARRVLDEGGQAEDVTCPATTTVAQDVTAVCHGTDWGDPATFVVFFEDAQGAYTLLEL